MLAKTKELKIVKRIFLDRLGGLILILLNSSDKIFQCGEFQWGMLGKRKHGDFGPERGSRFSQILLLSILEDGAVLLDWKRYKLFIETSHPARLYKALSVGICLSTIKVSGTEVSGWSVCRC